MERHRAKTPSCEEDLPRGELRATFQVVTPFLFYSNLGRLPMLANLAVSYGLMMFTLYSGSITVERLDPLARILACGTVMCVGLGQLTA